MPIRVKNPTTKDSTRFVSVLKPFGVVPIRSSFSMMLRSKRRLKPVPPGACSILDRVVPQPSVSSSQQRYAVLLKISWSAR